MMNNLTEGLMKGLVNMGLDKLISSQLEKFQASDTCPKSIKKLDSKEAVADAMQFMKFNKDQEEDRKAYGGKFLKKYFAIFEPMLTQYLLLQELKVGAKYELVLSIHNDAVFFDTMEKLKADPRYDADIYPRLEEIVKETDSDLETEIFSMVRNALEAKGQPVSLQCTVIKRNMDTQEMISTEERHVSELREYFKNQ